MAKNRQPVAKRCKALGISPAAMGYYKKETARNSANQSRRKKSEYAMQLQEKQKVKARQSRRQPAHPARAPSGQCCVPPGLCRHPP